MSATERAEVLVTSPGHTSVTPRIITSNGVTGEVFASGTGPHVVRALTAVPG